MNSPRVLMFGWEYAPFYSGGLGIVTRSIIHSLKKQGMEVIFVLPKMPYEVDQDILKIINASKIRIDTLSHHILSQISVDSFISPYEGVENFKERMELLLKDKLESYEYLDPDSNAKQLYGTDLVREVEKYANRALAIAKENNHSVIHTHDWMTARAGVVAKSVSDKPLIMHVHATEFDRTGGNPNQTVYDIEREGMEAADKVIAVSEFTKQKIMQYYGISEHKISVVHNAIDKYDEAKRLPTTINKSDKIVLFLGRLTLQKGAEYLLEAAEKVLRHKKRVKFVFVGTGDMLQQLVHRSIELGIEKKVMFAGFMDHKEIDKAYQMADVYVMPSVSEPFGITALEAIKNNTPVIISKQSGVSEVIQNSLKVDFWDTDELANQILGVIRYEPLGLVMAQNAEEELRRLSWDKQSEKIVNVYHEITKI